MRKLALLLVLYGLGCPHSFGCEVERGLPQEVFPSLFREQLCGTLTECGVYADMRTCSLSIGTLVIDGTIPDCPCYDTHAANRCVEALRQRQATCDPAGPSLDYPADCTQVCCASGCTADSCQLASLSPVDRCNALLASSQGTIPPLVAELTGKAALEPQCYTVPLIPTVHKDSSVQPKLPDPSVTAQLVYFARASGTAVDLGARFPCSVGGSSPTACADRNPPPPTEPVYVLVYETAQPLVLSDHKNLYELGFVFDADGDPTDDFIPPDQYSDDFFAGTDRWYTANYSPVTGWLMKVQSANMFTVSETPSRARIVLRGSTASLIVPVSEFSFSDPPARVTLFRHDGSYGLGGGDWSGQVFPAQKHALMRRGLRLPF
jgi:hypothetical protein